MDDTQSNRPDNLGDISDSGLILLKAIAGAGRYPTRDSPCTHQRPRRSAPENGYDPQSCDGPARGTGGIPWQLDLDHEEARLFAPMASAGSDGRVLARQLREVIARRHDRLLARWREPGGCPFDLHRLLPIPEPVLQLGEDDPQAQNWLWAHWGTTRLRAVRIREEGADRRLRRKAEIVYEFRSADWTPWRAVLRLRRNWPKLVLTVQPRYDDG